MNSFVGSPAGSPLLGGWAGGGTGAWVEEQDGQ
jgi:hypothetical protein